MMRRAGIVCGLLLLSSQALAADCVVLLHGLARTATSMNPMQRALIEEGFETANIGYASRDNTVEELAEIVIPQGLEACRSNNGVGHVHFVTHSLGGILLRQYLSLHPIPDLGRVVMLGPPNKGSEVVDRLGKVPGFHFINGDAGLELGTGEASLPNRLGPANFDLGIIAGTRSVNPFLSTLITGPNDGKVSVENTRLEGMNDHIEMAVTHSFMMGNKAVIAQVIHYLANGCFERSG